RGHVRETARHVGAVGHVLLWGEAPDAARIAQQFAFGDADAGLVGTEVGRRDELDRVSGHHGQAAIPRQAQRRLDIGFVPVETGTLQFDEVAIWEIGGPLAREAARLFFATRLEGLADVAPARARQ